MSAFARPTILVLFAAASACALVLDLPSPALDPGGRADGSAFDGSNPDSNDGATSDGSTTVDGSSDAPTSCDLTLPANCGACGVDCSNGTCRKGVCTLVDGLYGARGIAIVGSAAFITIPDETKGVGRCATNGCATVATVLPLDGSTYQAPSAIVANVSEGAIYTTSYESNATGGVFRTPMDGGPTVHLNYAQPTNYSESLAISGDTVLWTSNYSPGGVFSCPITGCPSGIPAVFGSATAYGTSVIAAPDGRVFYTTNNDIRWCSNLSCAGGSKTVATSQGNSVGSLALAPDGDTLYWARSFPDVGISRRSVTADGGVPQVVVDEMKQTPSSTLIVGDQLFWTMEGTDPNPNGASFPLALTTDGRVRKCRLPACSSSVVDVAPNEPAPLALATDGTAIYWVNSGVAGSTGGRGNVRKAPL